ncbi:MAG: hypothetical protein GY835_07565 [bacterium]|nr:hypothetical protein [bacterium]
MSIIFLLLLSIAVTMASVPTEVPGAGGGNEGNDTCCAHGDDPSADAADATDDEDCCPRGCRSCLLFCCGGPVSLHTSSLIPVPEHDSTEPVPPHRDGFSLSQPKEIFHPPRI